MERRIASIESFRVLAIFGVILVHTDVLWKFRQLTGGSLFGQVTTSLVWWVSVPYFFITAGYFFRKSLRTHGKPIACLRRHVTPLVWLLLSWVFIYIMIPNNWPGEVLHHGWWQPFYSEALKNMNLFATQHVRLFLVGDLPVWHLWFLPALMFSLATLTLVAVYRLQRYVIPLIVSLYVLALTEEAGRHILSSTYSYTYDLRGWSIGLLLTALGWWLAGREQPSVRMALCLILGGYAFAFMEGAVMSAFFHSTPQAIRDHPYLGGILLVLGIFLLALAKPTLGQSTPLPFLAQFTLGVYVSHVLVLYTLAPIRSRMYSLWPESQLLFAFAVYFFAVLFVLVLSKIPLARYLVTRTSSGALTQIQDGNPITDTV
ncbi:MAG: acyltransferase [Nitrospirota bacterium]